MDDPAEGQDAERARKQEGDGEGDQRRLSRALRRRDDRIARAARELLVVPDPLARDLAQPISNRRHGTVERREAFLAAPRGGSERISSAPPIH